MRAHYLQHVPFEGLGSIEAWLRGAGYKITCTRFFESASVPDLDDVDCLVVMGGPMSVNDEEDFPWLVQEKDFIRRAIESGKPVLGVCLGAQLIASACGARVYPNRCKEIGWFSVRATGVDGPACFQFPERFDAFHWNGETFDLPAGAVRLAESAGCENQAFQRGESTIGLQFHPEVTPESVREIIANCRAELESSEYVQTELAMLSAPAEAYRSINRLMDEVLSFLHRSND